MNRKAQTSIEFVLLFSFMLLVFVIFVILIQSKINDVKQERVMTKMRDIGGVVLEEVRLARSVSLGYARNFTLPRTIDGESYSIEIIDNNDIVVHFKNDTVVLFLPANVTGNVSPGMNIIWKLNVVGTIKLRSADQAPDCGDNFAELPEVCDGTDLEGMTCPGLGFAGGTVSCKEDCTGFDLSSCLYPICNDGFVVGDEECDPGSGLANLNGQSCMSRGFGAGGMLACTENCTFNTSQCMHCNTANGQDYNTLYYPLDNTCLITFQPNETLAEDTYLDMSDAFEITNFGNDFALKANYNSSWQNGGLLTLIKFNITPIPYNANITNATLFLFQYDSIIDAEGSIDMQVHRMLVSWDELKATAFMRENTSTPVYWSQEGLNASDYDAAYVQAAYDAATMNDMWWNFNLNSLVQNWVNRSFQNYGMALFGSQAHSAPFWNSSSSLADVRPKLVVAYQPVISAVCGDGFISPGENCDNASYNGIYGFCNETCTHVLVCGDNELTAPNETCDGTDLGGTTCLTLGMPPGLLACNADCQGFNTSLCGINSYCPTGNITNYYTTTDNGDHTCTIVFQPSATYGKDSYIDSNEASYPHGSLIKLGLHSYIQISGIGGGPPTGATIGPPAEPAYSPGFAYPFVEFNLAPLPNVSIVRANVSFYQYSASHGQGNYIFSILPVLQAWSENTITWNNAPGAGAAVIDSPSIPSNMIGWISFNITALVNTWLVGENYGMEVFVSNPGTGRGTWWWASSNYLSNPRLRPKLNITYMPRACGDNVTVDPEVCDGIDLNGSSCTSLGFAAGTVSCLHNCSAYNTSACTMCGNGIIDPGEECDGQNLNEENCSTLLGEGWTGTLNCTDCHFDETNCVAPSFSCPTGNMPDKYTTTMIDTTTCSIHFQPSEEYSLDTYASEEETYDNFGEDNLLRISATSSKKKYAYVEFDLTPIKTAPLELIATFGLFNTGSSGSCTGFDVVPIKQDWDELRLNWNNQPEPYPEMGTVPMTGGMLDWVKGDVTTFVRMYDAAIPNYGFVVLPGSGCKDESMLSSNTSEEEKALRPYLDVIYKVPEVPCLTGSEPGKYYTRNNNDGTCTLVFQPSEEIMEDTYVDYSKPDQNFGNAPTLLLSSDEVKQLILLRYRPDIIKEKGLYVTNATLLLLLNTTEGGSVPCQLELWHIASDWKEDETTAESTPGFDKKYSTSTEYVDYTGWVALNANGYVIDYVQGDAPYGILLLSPIGTGEKTHQFLSSSTPREDLRPKLLVTYRNE
ncbi:MAG: DNRLRE domain-containing protein [archaeon]